MSARVCKKHLENALPYCSWSFSMCSRSQPGVPEKLLTLYTLLALDQIANRGFIRTVSSRLAPVHRVRQYHYLWAGYTFPSASFGPLLLYSALHACPWCWPITNQHQVRACWEVVNLLGLLSLAWIPWFILVWALIRRDWSSLSDVISEKM
jgi:hypothetical protein